MNIIIKDGGEYLPYPYEREDELETMVKKQADILFRDSLFFDKVKISANSKISAIPDGFTLMLKDERWCIVEIELASHSLHDHIVPQISKFSSAIKNHDTRRKLIDLFYDTIQNDIQLKNKYASMELKKELYKILTDIINNKDPEIVIIIDEKNKELEEVCSILPFQAKSLEFKTYRNKDDVNDFVYLFDTLENVNKKHPVIMRQSSPKPVDSQGVNHLHSDSKTLMQILEVSELALFEGKEYTEAVKIVANRRNLDEPTVRDKCVRRLRTSKEDPFNTDRFKELLRNKEELISFLIKKFPNDADLINKRLKR